MSLVWRKLILSIFQQCTFLFFLMSVLFCCVLHMSERQLHYLVPFWSKVYSNLPKDAHKRLSKENCKPLTPRKNVSMYQYAHNNNSKNPPIDCHFSDKSKKKYSYLLLINNTATFLIFIPNCYFLKITNDYFLCNVAILNTKYSLALHNKWYPHFKWSF